MDLVGNEVHFENKYVHLQPKSITDANKDHIETTSDTIGQNIGAAMVGKLGKDMGDSLEGLRRCYRS